MTEAQFVAKLEAIGATNVRQMSKPTDRGMGVGVTFERNGKTERHAVIIPRSGGDAYSAILDWVSA